MSKYTKQTTLLRGLPVAKLPHHTLGNIYNRILRALTKLPENSVYRLSTEQIVKERAEILKQNSDVTEVEKKINCGQVEELIVQAENELTLTRKMVVWKPWEPLISQEPANQWTWPPHK